VLGHGHQPQGESAACLTRITGAIKDDCSQHCSREWRVLQQDKRGCCQAQAVTPPHTAEAHLPDQAQREDLLRVTERLTTAVQLNAELLAENSTLTQQLQVWPSTFRASMQQHVCTVLRANCLCCAHAASADGASHDCCAAQYSRLHAQLSVGSPPALCTRRIPSPIIHSCPLRCQPKVQGLCVHFDLKFAYKPERVTGLSGNWDKKCVKQVFCATESAAAMHVHAPLRQHGHPGPCDLCCQSDTCRHAHSDCALADFIWAVAAAIELTAPRGHTLTCSHKLTPDGTQSCLSHTRTLTTTTAPHHCTAHLLCRRRRLRPRSCSSSWQPQPVRVSSRRSLRRSSAQARWRSRARRVQTQVQHGRARTARQAAQHARREALVCCMCACARFSTTASSWAPPQRSLCGSCATPQHATCTARSCCSSRGSANARPRSASRRRVRALTRWSSCGSTVRTSHACAPCMHARSAGPAGPVHLCPLARQKAALAWPRWRHAAWDLTGLSLSRACRLARAEPEIGPRRYNIWLPISFLEGQQDGLWWGQGSA
jgi:hypothetical protein